MKETTQISSDYRNLELEGRKKEKINYENGEFVREGNAGGGSEQEYRVVHVPGGMDYLYSHRILRMAPRSLHFRLLSWNGLDHC